MASAIELLRKLPEVFTLNTLASMTGGDANKASVYASRWRNNDLIEPLGLRVGVYFNLFKNPQAKDQHLLDAVRLVYPEAVMSGASVIHLNGWTTQIPRSVDLNILERRSTHQIDGVSLHARPRQWFADCQSHIIKDGLARLTPELALADAWKYKLWQPDPDDLEFDSINTKKLKKAFEVLDTPYPKYYPDADEFAIGMQLKSRGKNANLSL